MPPGKQNTATPFMNEALYGTKFYASHVQISRGLTILLQITMTEITPYALSLRIIYLEDSKVKLQLVHGA